MGRPDNAGHDGAANTGGGGGGEVNAGNAGGSGMVYVRIPSDKTLTATTGSPSTGVDATYRYYGWTGSGSFTV